MTTTLIQTILQILIGVALLTCGRKLFWLFVAVIGFIAGFWLAARLFENRPQEVLLGVAVAFGIGGAVAAHYLQRLAVGLAGFLAGGFAAYRLLTMLGFEDFWLWVGTFLLLGAVGAALVALVFNAALIILTAVTGALLIIEPLPFDLNILAVLFVVILVVGLAMQLGQPAGKT